MTGRQHWRNGLRGICLVIVLLALQNGMTLAAEAEAWEHLHPVSPDGAFQGSLDPADVRAQAERMQIMTQRDHRIHQLLGGRIISRRGMDRLSGQGLGPALLKSGADPMKAGAKRTLKILLIRIGFESDLSGDLTSVTTDGDFQLTVDDSTFYRNPIDTPPHDREFYEHHLYGLSEYYRIQSGGRLEIESEVLPLENDRCYKMSDLSNYAPGAGNYWTIAQLETLVIDMISTADSAVLADNKGYDLSDYADDDADTYIIFVHAGGDFQSDIYGDSPNDIPTFFVVLGNAVPLQSGGTLSECSMIPETTSQDGYLGSIAGALYHEFGHSLGLPDVYDTTTGLPAVGYWDLMDSGPNLVAGFYIPDPADPNNEAKYLEVYASGAMPPSLSAWCRWYLGWLDVEVISGANRAYHLPASQIPRSDYSTWYDRPARNGYIYDFSPSYPQALIGGVSPREFFLMENRWVPLADLSDLPDNQINFVSRGSHIVSYLGGDPIDPADPDSQPRNVGLYDFFMPGGGLLVWHVNREKIDAGLYDNVINGGGHGLGLVEADGIQDVGVFQGYPMGIMGSAYDPFHAGTNPELLGAGRPSTRTYDGAYTGLEITSISAELPTLTFNARVASLSAASPMHLPSRADDRPRMLAAESLTPCVLKRDGTDVQALFHADLPADAGGEVWLYGIDQSGNPLLNPVNGISPAGACLQLDTPLVGAPLIAPLGPDKAEGLLMVTASGQVSGLKLEATAGVMPSAWSATPDIGSAICAPVVTFDEAGEIRISICLRDGGLAVLDGQGSIRDANLDPGLGTGVTLGTAIVPPLVLRNDTESDTLIYFGQDAWALLDPAADPAQTPIVGSYPLETDGLVAAVIPLPDSSMLMLANGDGELQVVSLPSGTPLWDYRILGDPLRDPAVADVDGDGRHELILLTTTHLYVFRGNGSMLSGFPLPLTDQFPFQGVIHYRPGLSIFDSNGDGYPEIYCNTSQGHLMGFDPSGRLLDRLPLLWGDGRTGAISVGASAESGRVMWLVESGGRDATGFGRTQIDGRIVGILPTSNTDGGRTAEWLGWRGGVQRSGPQGVLTDLGGWQNVNVPDIDFMAYPNPAREDLVRFRFQSTAAGSATVLIYTLEGEIVDRLQKTVQSGLPEEIIWQLQGMPSGVYLCKLIMPTATGVEHRLLTLAVEH